MFRSIFFCGALLLLSACSAPVQFGLPSQTDNFSQGALYNNKVDMIWLVDNSSSMMQHQDRLISQIDPMIETLRQLKLDVHLVIITTDMGSEGSGGQFVGEPKVMNLRDSNVAADIKSRLRQGQNGSNLERGLLSLATVLSPTYLSGEGAGFIRPEARLVINVLSDEDDASGGTLDSYVDILDDLKPDYSEGDKAWILNFIGVLSPSGACSTFNEYSAPGYDYMALAEISGGITSSICSANLSQAVSDLRARLIEKITDYKLGREPVVDSIRVYMNGVVVPRSSVSGWDYLPGDQIIRFYGAYIPSSDVRIVVEYDRATAN